MDKQDFLCEIGCEELPTRSVQRLGEALRDLTHEALTKAPLAFERVTYYATPRRLAVYVHDLQTETPQQETERQGPSLDKAYDKEGIPTLACIGFAKSCGVSVDQLQTKETSKGKRVYCKTVQPGLSTKQLLPSLMESVFKQLPIAKPMRWGDNEVAFVRPVHWVVCLFGSDVLDATFFGKRADRMTVGHRFHHPKTLPIHAPKDYATLLSAQGFVIPDYATRRDKIKHAVIDAAKPYGQALIDEALLDEVTALVEWPQILLGSFPEAYLNVPKEVLITSMQTHQKYFPIENAEGALLPHFIIVSNIASESEQTVIQGNERVLNARLSDAAFFYENDLKHSLESRLEKLQHVIFQKTLGTMAERSERIAQLAKHIAASIDADPNQAEHAGRLSKCDLVSEMVLEFPDLQGIMGYYYACNDNEPNSVALAIQEHYLPRFSGDALPSELLGCAVSLAYRIDTLVGIFGINKIPTGEKDPYALRRAGQGILRILIEKSLDLDLMALLKKAHSAYEVLPNHDVVEQTFSFLMDRLKYSYVEQNISPDIFEAVLACDPTKPLDFNQRVQAVLHFQTLPEASALAAANKRVSNILKKTETGALSANMKPDLFEHPEEHQLAQALADLEPKIESLYQAGHYTDALSELASLKAPVDAFFDKVMVMADDEALRNNRLALLTTLQKLFSRVADLSLLPG